MSTEPRGTTSMDWEALASAALDQVETPVLVLDGGGRLRLVNQPACSLLGVEPDRAIGADFVEGFVPEEHRRGARWWIERMVRGAVREHRLSVRTGGLRLELDVRVSAVPGAALLRVEAWTRMDPAAEAAEAETLLFEIDTDFASFGTIRLWEAMVPQPAGSMVGERCYAVLRGSHGPCDDCPSRELDVGGGESTRVVACGDGYELQTVRRTGSGRARVSVRRIDERTRGRISEAHVKALARRRGLSQREEEVLRYLLIGGGTEEIARILRISARTVRFHQANLLQKLGAESRADLIRLLL